MVDFGGLTVTLDLDFEVLSVTQEVSSPWESLAPRAPRAQKPALGESERLTTCLCTWCLEPVGPVGQVSLEPGVS